MNNNNIYYDTDIIDQSNASLTRGSIDYDDTRETSARNFAKLKAREIFPKGFNKLEKAMDALSKTMENSKKVNEAYKEQIITFEKSTASKIDAMKMPKGFSINESMELNTFEDVSLNKIDGRSVNEGHASIEQEMTDNYNSVTAENLGNINNEIEQQQQELDNIDDVKEMEKLRDMTGKEEQQEQVYDDRVNINNQMLNKVETNVDAGIIKDSDINYTINKKEIDNMEGEELK